VTTVSSSTGAPTDAIETTVMAGGDSLQYDPTAGQDTHVWKTNANWAGTCVQADLRLNDGSTHTFLVQLKSDRSPRAARLPAGDREVPPHGLVRGAVPGHQGKRHRFQVIAAWPGHTGAAFTMRTYVHARP
jgi:hypothetical protein